jgi:hypothetical protein
MSGIARMVASVRKVGELEYLGENRRHIAEC